MPVKLPNGIAEQKQQSNLHTQGVSEYPNCLFGCPAQGTEPNSAQHYYMKNVKWSFCYFLNFCFVPKYIGMDKGFSFSPCQILIAIHEVLVEICNGNHYVLVCILGIMYLARPLRYLDILYLFRAHVPCMCMCTIYASYDVTSVCIQSKPHHHYVIGVCILFMPHRIEEA